MKNITTILGITLLVGVLAIPTFLWAQGRGWGGGMMGNWGGNAGYGCQYDGDDASLSNEQQEKLSALDKKLFQETKDIRNKLWSKSAELNTLLKTADPDISKVKAVQKEISELRNSLDEKNVTREVEARKIAPEASISANDGYGRMGYGRGYGPHMYGPGYGMGYGWHMGGPGYGMVYGPGNSAN